MLDSFGTALRAMREAADLSLAALAGRANVSKPQLGRLENGDRAPTIGTARAIDEALRGGGVLVELAAAERGGHEMRRRALLATIGAAAGTGALAGPHTMGDLIRHGLLDAAGAGDDDWDQVVDDSRHRLVSDPSPLFGAALITNLMRLRDQLTAASTPSTAMLRAAAELGQIYGLWLGNQAHLGGANHWYRAAATLADRSGDKPTRAYVRGRAASRAIYEGWSVRQTLDTVDAALALSGRPSAGALEAHAARVSVHALSGDVQLGRAAVADMADVAEALDDANLYARTVFLSAFLEARVGGLDDAMQACDLAEPVLAGDAPTWLTETRVYRARALVAAGDVDDGLGCALDAVQGLRHDVRVIGVAIRDVLAALPAGHRSYERDQLVPYADPNPGPWETLR